MYRDQPTLVSMTRLVWPNSVCSDLSCELLVLGTRIDIGHISEGLDMTRLSGAVVDALGL
jgi:hypothetical protein